MTIKQVFISSGDYHYFQNNISIHMFKIDHELNNLNRYDTYYTFEITEEQFRNVKSYNYFINYDKLLALKPEFKLFQIGSEVGWFTNATLLIGEVKAFNVTEIESMLESILSFLNQSRRINVDVKFASFQYKHPKDIGKNLIVDFIIDKSLKEFKIISKEFELTELESECINFSEPLKECDDPFLGTENIYSVLEILHTFLYERYLEIDNNKKIKTQS